MENSPTTVTKGLAPAYQPSPSEIFVTENVVMAVQDTYIYMMQHYYSISSQAADKYAAILNHKYSS